MSLLVTAGQAGDSPQFTPVIKAIRVPRLGGGLARTRPDRVLADKAYSSKNNRASLRGRGIKATQVASIQSFYSWSCHANWIRVTSNRYGGNASKFIESSLGGWNSEWDPGYGSSYR